MYFNEDILDIVKAEVFEQELGDTPIDEYSDNIVSSMETLSVEIGKLLAAAEDISKIASIVSTSGLTEPLAARLDEYVISDLPGFDSRDHALFVDGLVRTEEGIFDSIKKMIIKLWNKFVSFVDKVVKKVVKSFYKKRSKVLKFDTANGKEVYVNKSIWMLIKKCEETNITTALSDIVEFASNTKALESLLKHTGNVSEIFPYSPYELSSKFDDIARYYADDEMVLVTKDNEEDLMELVLAGESIITSVVKDLSKLKLKRKAIESIILEYDDPINGDASTVIAGINGLAANMVKLIHMRQVEVDSINTGVDKEVGE